MADDDPQPTDPAMAAQLEEWRVTAGAPPARGAWRTPAKYVVAALLLLFFVPVPVRFLVFVPIPGLEGYGILLAILALPPAIVYGVFRALR